MNKESLSRLIGAAQGKVDCDLVIKGAKFLDVFSCKWKKADVSIVDGHIVALESGLKSKRVVDGKDKFLVPGFIDAHVHVESSLLMPSNFEQTVLTHGTTSAICDPHELANVQGLKGIEYFIKAAEKTKMNLRVMLSSCVPATHMETNGAGFISAEELDKISRHPKVLGLAEMMNIPGVLNSEKSVMDKLETFSDRKIDGHCPLVRGQQLSAYAAAGISSCHESSELEEAREKLMKGMAVWIREGSVAKDLNALIPLLELATSTSIGFCTDDRNPKDIDLEGHIDHLIRSAISYGVSPEVVYRSASWSVARHYGLSRLGAIAPGYEADLVLLNDASTCDVNSVFKSGVKVSELEFTQDKKEKMENSVRAKIPEAKDLEAPQGSVHVIGVQAGRILTDRHVMSHDDKSVARLSVLERYGKGSKPANAYVKGFGDNFSGAIGSSVGHDSHNLIVVGKDTEDMRVALAFLKESGGGFCVVKNKQVIASLELPFGGLMTGESHEFITARLNELHSASHSIGCELPEPFLQLAFLSLPVIPSLKLTDHGLVDVEKFQVIDVRAS